MNSTSTQYRLTVARLIAGTFGDEFDHTQFQWPHVVAESFPDAGAIQECLNECMNSFESGPQPTGAAAMKKANEFIEAALKVALGEHAHLLWEEVTYRPIYNESGDVVGHDTITVIVRNGEPVRIPLTPVGGGLQLGGIAIVFLAVGAI